MGIENSLKINNFCKKEKPSASLLIPYYKYYKHL